VILKYFKELAEGYYHNQIPTQHRSGCQTIMAHTQLGKADKKSTTTKSISIGAQYVTPYSNIYCEKVKMCPFSSGNGSPNSCSLPCLVKVATQLCASKNECNKLDLTVAQYF
jgi:hypothetical protein